MNRTQISRRLALPAVLVALAGAAVFAGPLNPPSGPVASTYKTLTEVEPRIAVNATNTPAGLGSSYHIGLPGSYYLTGNITAALDKDGIAIDCDGVTLDLNGFDLYDYLAIGTTTRYGVSVAAGVSNVTIKNGSIREWHSGGIYCQGSGCRVENVQVKNCHGEGIYCLGKSVITNCTAVGSSDWGIYVGAGSVVTNCSASSNTSGGFHVGYGSSLNGCTAYANTGTGYWLQGAVARGCGADSNNTYGFDAYGAMVLDCSATGNAVYGIRVNAGCVIRGNNCDTQSFPNIYIAAGNNRIEGNFTTQGTFGIYCPAGVTNNYVVGNMVFGASNTGISVPTTNNFVGPVVTTTGTITSTSPFANFAH